MVEKQKYYKQKVQDIETPASKRLDLSAFPACVRFELLAVNCAKALIGPHVMRSECPEIGYLDKVLPYSLGHSLVLTTVSLRPQLSQYRLLILSQRFMKTKPPHQLTSGLYRFPPNRIL